MRASHLSLRLASLSCSIANTICGKPCSILTHAINTHENLGINTITPFNVFSSNRHLPFSPRPLPVGDEARGRLKVGGDDISTREGRDGGLFRWLELVLVGGPIVYLESVGYGGAEGGREWFVGGGGSTFFPPSALLGSYILRPMIPLPTKQCAGRARVGAHRPAGANANGVFERASAVATAADRGPTRTNADAQNTERVAAAAVAAADSHLFSAVSPSALAPATTSYTFPRPQPFSRPAGGGGGGCRKLIHPFPTAAVPVPPACCLTHPRGLRLR